MSRPGVFVGVAIVAGVGVWFGFGGSVFGGGTSWGLVPVQPNLEDQQKDGSPYTPGTQSFLRGEHALDAVTGAEISVSGDDRGSVRLEHPEIEFEVKGLAFDQLVPRLHYRAGEQPDAFDALNLLLAEYSRNGMSVPAGQDGDAMAHFETDLSEERPYRLEGDYGFVANEKFRPVRFAVINNCLAPGLWELSARDRSGEIYHSWMKMPDRVYHELVARANDLPVEFVQEAVKWKTEEVELHLSRLRKDARPLVDGLVPAKLRAGGKSGYSSQDSRRKLSKGYALIEREGDRHKPSKLDDLTKHPVHMSSFVEPGKYSMSERRKFDFRFLRGIKGVRMLRTTATTDYDWRRAKKPKARPGCLEFDLDLGEWRLVIGNLPIELLVPQEDFGIHGFGVGVLPSSDFAERRKFLIEKGPPPSFAYLYREQGGKKIAVNSHDYGLEQIFIRTHSNEDEPWFEVTLTSYERIVDIVKYRVEVPRALVADLKSAAANYAAPIYRTYRDDNLR